MQTSRLSVKSMLDKARIRWFRGQEPSQRDQQGLDTVVGSLFETVVGAAFELRRRTATRAGKEEGLIPQPWSLEIELLWFLLASIMRGVSRIPEMGPEARDSLHSELLETFIAQLLDHNRLSPAQSGQRARMVGRLQRWYGQALGEYQGISRILPSADAISMSDSMCGRAARRMAASLGKRDNLLVELTFSSWIVEVWLAVDPPKVASLCARIHLNSRAPDRQPT